MDLVVHKELWWKIKCGSILLNCHSNYWEKPSDHMSLLVDNKYIQFFKYTKREAQIFCVIYSEQWIVIVLET